MYPLENCCCLQGGRVMLAQCNNSIQFNREVFDFILNLRLKSITSPRQNTAVARKQEISIFFWLAHIWFPQHHSTHVNEAGL